MDQRYRNLAAIAAAILAALDEGHNAISYRWVAERMPKYGGQRFAPVALGQKTLYKVSAACKALGVPEITTVIVPGWMLDRPDEALREHSMLFEVPPDDIPAQQHAVRSFKWTEAIRAKLTDPAFYEWLDSNSPRPVSLRTLPGAAEVMREMAKVSKGLTDEKRDQMLGEVRAVLQRWQAGT